MSEIRSAYDKRLTDDTHGYLDEDMRPEERRDGEFEFFITQARECGQPVLELASGAARVMMPLAKAGIEVYGLEASPYMLELAEKAVRHWLTPEELGRIHFIRGDMTSFELPVKFPLIAIPFCSFWFNFCRVSGQDAEVFGLADNCIRCIISALADNGTFIIDTPYFVCGDRAWWPEASRKHGFTYEVVTPYRDSSYAEVLIGRKIG